MSWAIKGLDGPLKNKKYYLKTGMTLGRQGEVQIPDTKASSIHARILLDTKGNWHLEDNSSKNGTRVKGERITSIQLVPGMIFFIGEQSFEVREYKKESADAPGEVKAEVFRAGKADPPPIVKTSSAQKAKVRAAPSPQPPPPQPPPQPKAKPQPQAAPPPPTRAAEPEPMPEPLPTPPKKRYWHEILAEFLEKHEGRFGERKLPVSALNPAVVLEFVRGVQVHSRWVLGYGPRKIGSNSLDLPIWEPGAPAVCFEILPSTDGIVFKTTHPDLVKVNGESIDSQVLSVGDTIRINETLIEVDFTE